MVRFRAACHPACIACRSTAEGGLGLRFERQDDGSVAASFTGAPSYQGYPDRLHGGIIATLLDAAMTHCLFARRIRGYTARLEVRYQRPVGIGTAMVVRAWIVQARSRWFRLGAEISQASEVRVIAEAVFQSERSP